MKITVKQTGGFAGVEVDLASVDTTTLDAARAQQVEQLVRDAAFFQRPATVGSAVGADLAKYVITVTDGSRQHTVTLEQADNSPETAPLHRLVQSLLQMA
jgi:hypothetical protein